MAVGDAAGAGTKSARADLQTIYSVDPQPVDDPAAGEAVYPVKEPL